VTVLSLWLKYVYFKRRICKSGFETPNALGDTIKKNEFFQQQGGRETNVLIRRTKKTWVYSSVTGLVGRIYFFLIKKVKNEVSLLGRLFLFQIIWLHHYLLIDNCFPVHKELIYCIYITLPDEQGGCLRCGDIEVVWVINIFNDPFVDGWIIPLGEGEGSPK